jgi:hypothetical protein
VNLTFIIIKTYGNQRDFDHTDTLLIKLYNPVYNQTCLHRSWILIYHCSKHIAGIILQLPYQLAGIKLQLTPKTGWTILYYYSSVVTDIVLTANFRAYDSKIDGVIF